MTVVLGLIIGSCLALIFLRLTAPRSRPRSGKRKTNSGIYPYPLLTHTPYPSSPHTWRKLLTFKVWIGGFVCALQWRIAPSAALTKRLKPHLAHRQTVGLKRRSTVRRRVFR